MKTSIVEKLEELKRKNPNTALDLSKERLIMVANEAKDAGFDPEWVDMLFDLTNCHNWVRMGIKLEHLCRVFKGRVVCVANFIKEDV